MLCLYNFEKYPKVKNYLEGKKTFFHHNFCLLPPCFGVSESKAKDTKANTLLQGLLNVVYGGDEQGFEGDGDEHVYHY